MQNNKIEHIIINNSKKVYARKCSIKEVTYKDSKKFLEQNHIQGDSKSKVRLGLFLEDELISLMTFGSLRKNLGSTSEEGSYELLRFCNKKGTTIVGGASKLLNYFEIRYSPTKIISYADRRWSSGSLYQTIGFKEVHKTKPNYFYIVNKKRENRFKYRKSELISAGFDKNKTEKQIMQEQGYSRIYDCGTLKFEKTINKQ